VHEALCFHLLLFVPLRTYIDGRPATFASRHFAMLDQPNRSLDPTDGPLIALLPSTAIA